MTEFEIRHQVNCICISDSTALSKARQLLKLRKELAVHLAQLEKAHQQVGLTHDLSSQAVLRRITASTLELHEEVEEFARDYLAKK